MLCQYFQILLHIFLILNNNILIFIINLNILLMREDCQCKLEEMKEKLKIIITLLAKKEQCLFNKEILSYQRNIR